MHVHGCKQTPPTPPTTSDEDSSGSTDDGEMKKKKGNRAMGKKKYPKAVKYYTKAVKIDPENPTYRLNRAIANAALELWKNAEADAEKAVELGNPVSAKSYFQWARARYKRGLLDEADKALDAGLAAFPEEPALLQLRRDIERSRAARETRQRQDAEVASAAAACSTEAPGSGMDAIKALLERARAAYGAEPEEAYRLCEAAREAAAACGDAGRREEINACSLQGKVAMRLRRWDDAAKAFERVASLEEEVYTMSKDDEREALANAYNNWGISLKNSGKMGQAAETLNKAYATATNFDDKVATPQVAQILQNLAQCLAQQSKMEEARGMYSRALEVGQRMYPPDHASHALNHLGIARCLKREGRLPEAVKAYTTAYELLRGKEPEAILAELPEVPSKERLTQLQEQCRQELGQLLLLFEEVRRQQGESGPAANGTDAVEPPAP